MVELKDQWTSGVLKPTIKSNGLVLKPFTYLQAFSKIAVVLKSLTASFESNLIWEKCSVYEKLCKLVHTSNVLQKSNGQEFLGCLVELSNQSTSRALVRLSNSGMGGRS